MTCALKRNKRGSFAKTSLYAVDICSYNVELACFGYMPSIAIQALDYGYCRLSRLT